MVPVAGLEPARPRALDFESSTSTNSITPAHSFMIINHNAVDFKRKLESLQKLYESCFSIAAL